MFTDHDPVPSSLKFCDFDFDCASHPSAILAVTNLMVPKKNCENLNGIDLFGMISTTTLNVSLDF